MSGREHGGEGAGVRQQRPGLGARARYWFDATLVRGTSALVGWLAAICFALVVPVNAVPVWTDPHSPGSRSARPAAVWHRTGETLRLGGTTGTPLRVLLSVLLALTALLYVSTPAGLITTGLTERPTALRRGRSRVLEQGHAVVLGRSEQVFTVVGELFSAGGTRIHLRSAADYVLTGHETSFATVVAAALNRGECAVGHRSHADAGTAPGYGVRINPAKTDRRTWREGDEVIVFTGGGHGPTAGTGRTE